MIEDDFAFYEANQNEIIEGHLNEFAVIKNKEVLGYYKTEEDAFDSMLGEELETFIVKKCRPLGTDVAEYFNNAVVFA
jgi:hypothetical protein